MWSSNVLGNQIPLAIVSMPPVVAHAKAGKMKVLAVTTAKRSPTLPEVPAVAELPGLSDYQFSNWMMVLAPAGTPAAIVAKIAADVGRIVHEPATRKKLQEPGVEPAGVHGAELAKFMQQERALHRRRSGAQRPLRGLRRGRGIVARGIDEMNRAVLFPFLSCGNASGATPCGRMPWRV
ncbi:MAG: Bug family tripartite tricarboxylate transporter substrate binding protein [Ramlibacter sp.]